MNRNYCNCPCNTNTHEHNAIDADNICNLDCRQLKQLVMDLGFTIIDLTMYLDTHPYDCEALTYFNKIKETNMLVRKEYASKCGPLTADMAGCDDFFNWIMPPMPWENCK